MLYCLVVFLMVLYPPFNLTIQGLVVRSEYSWLWNPIMYGSEYGKTPIGVIDVARLSMQFIGVSLIAVALTFSFRGKKI